MTRILRRSAAVLAGTTVLTLGLTGCVGGSGGAASGGGDSADIDTSSASGTIDYWLWDNNQKAAYQQCADDFHTANPDVSVTISQYSWDDYWTKLTNGFVAGTAPDVFTDHLSKFADFVNNGQVVSLDGVVEKDGVDVSQYQKGLADLWVGEDGERYGLPKDWDTTAIFYNQALVEDGGYTADQIAGLDWNPDDGGSYEKAIAHLTVDVNGVRGDEAGFDKTRVAVYGLGLDGQSGGGNGQTQWSMYAGTTGWSYTDKNPWGTKYNYDDERFQATIGWMAKVIDEGYMPSLAAVTGSDSTQTFGAGKYAMITNGSWNINSFYGLKDIQVGTAPTPTGPDGKRATMFNGLADSIWSGSDNKAASAKWVEYMASADCQNVIGAAGVVFPAIPSGSDAAQAAFAERGIDVTAFTGQVDEGTTFLFPISDNAAKINGIMQPAVDAVFEGQAEPSSLSSANDQVNALFQ
ncbi:MULTISPECIES: sugar ABC transporter substrate-binding protein [unclassified Rathayibacter]|uniref:ABC transporter substrate-binding protein n=1 Tax=unclassified Rathayibacter TaxID=2609250 RepID=UPI000F4BCD13|nr:MULTISPECIES: sugar ABC transporter substrate-binding protein [unclassified Rathayibacter]MCJ1671913.1 sugar ABC transporter substrate-binding protein [Rathayibacter sp. VKM Ac-2929]MCJ1686709.1 sugar ABC transporter substrate-binding protein [Rathayibacter sp. VKM Ac-2927]ROP48760.1 carbohydrate ABC transporter substrate-binding protein (CUT1 family) [Rathayibacter sp. PhB186]ROS49909.1 carbohydrate ABC transporter substrate-binding protein (CUT1 family) [Rathayibacter sp. PhB185]